MKKLKHMISFYEFVEYILFVIIVANVLALLSSMFLTDNLLIVIGLVILVLSLLDLVKLVSLYTFHLRMTSLYNSDEIEWSKYNGAIKLKYFNEKVKEYEKLVSQPKNMSEVNFSCENEGLTYKVKNDVIYVSKNTVKISRTKVSPIDAKSAAKGKSIWSAVHLGYSVTGTAIWLDGNYYHLSFMDFINFLGFNKKNFYNAYNEAYNSFNYICAFVEEEKQES